MASHKPNLSIETAINDLECASAIVDKLSDAYDEDGVTTNALSGLNIILSKIHADLSNQNT